MTDKTEKHQTINVDGTDLPITGEHNILEICRKAGIDIPTFCYQPELSVYGACRMCFVDIEGRGLQTSCSTKPEPGMKIKTNTAQIRDMRKTIMELILASHPQDCLHCEKSTNCALQSMAKKVGVTEISYKIAPSGLPRDVSSHAVVREPDKCIKCGSCVRMCDEIQSIAALGFEGRSSKSIVVPAMGEDFGKTSCINCGQCTIVCPTAALHSKSENEEVIRAINDPNKIVVAQIAPSVHVSIGEMFGMEPGYRATKEMVGAMKDMGFDYVFDTCLGADLTIVEEATEFLKRKEEGGIFPMFTSCCPGWMKYVETYRPSLLGNLSSCRSPMQMFGSLIRRVIPELTGKSNKDIVVVAIMPCTAKKFECRRPEYTHDGIQDVNNVITTYELGMMIAGHGLDLKTVKPRELDAPLSVSTGGGIIFGATGGVTEAVLRFAADKYGGIKDAIDFKEVRGTKGIREAEIELKGEKLKIAVVHGLSNIAKITAEIEKGDSPYALVEFMACPMGCIGGGGQPISVGQAMKKMRTKGLFKVDKANTLRKSQENYVINDYYKKLYDGQYGSHKAHHDFHTHYTKRAKMPQMVELVDEKPGALDVVIRMKGFEQAATVGKKAVELVEALKNAGVLDKVNLKSSFLPPRGTEDFVISVGGKTLDTVDTDKVIGEVKATLQSWV